MIDRHPALIVRCSGADDVARCIAFARAHDALIAVRGGGHNGGGLGVVDDGIVIDLAGMAEVTVDPDSDSVRVGGGCTWAQVDQATAEYGRATPVGDHLDDRRRRAHPRRWARPPDPALRPHDRQPDRSRRRPRRRLTGTRERQRAPRAVLGAARRRRQLRCRHVLRVPHAPDRGLRDGRADFLADRADTGGDALLPRIPACGAARRQRLLRADDSAAR